MWYAVDVRKKERGVTEGMNREQVKKEWLNLYWKKQEMTTRKMNEDERKEVKRMSERMQEIMNQIIWG